MSIETDGHEWQWDDLAHAIRNAEPDEPVEDEDGYIYWNGRSKNAMNTGEPC